MLRTQATIARLSEPQREGQGTIIAPIAGSPAWRALVAAGRSDELVQQLDATSPTTVGRDAGLEIAIAEWNAGRAAEALRRMRSLVQRYPEDAGLNHAAGWMLFQQSETRSAKAHARKAVDREAGDARHLALLAAIELADRRPTEAEAAATSLAALVPDAAAPHKLLGQAAASRAAWQVAERHFDRSLELDEYARDTLLSRAEVLERSGKIRGACEDLLRAGKTEQSVLATKLAPLVDRTLRVGHGALAVTVFWGLTGVPGAFFNLLELVVVTCLFVAAAIALAWHRRRLHQIPDEAKAAYRTARVVAHVTVALFGSVMVLFVVGVVLGTLIPRGVDSAVTGTIMIASTVLLTVAALIVPDVWRSMRGLPVRRSSLLAF